MTQTGKPVELATVDDSNDMKNNRDSDTHTPEEELPPAYDELDDTAMSDSNVQVPEPPLSHALSVIDDPETILDSNLGKVDEQVIDTKTFQWEISNWSDLPPRIESSAFEAGGYHWSILLFPRGNNQAETVSVYIKLADIATDTEAYACAQFGIFVSRPSDPTNYNCLSACHRFTRSASDWGFLRMVSIDRLLDDDSQTYRAAALLENNCIRITAIVRVVKDETGVLWHNFLDYDSKKTTGFVGLKNQGATCYMNSLFQSLYCTNYFRKAVYQIPTNDDDPTGSIAYALQRLFYNLQSSIDSVDTVEVTRSFGWDSSEAFMQHDVQEFNRILQETLETKMKANIRGLMANTPADGAIKKLFVGRMRSYIKCINVTYESSRSEDYYDIQLNVKGCSTLADSFADYIAEETLEGENKYSAEGYGLQDAKKGVIFESFPPVLHLQLKRFEYDINRDAMVKINDRHEFPLEIDLEPYLDSSVDRSEPHKYILHGVLVHSGDLTAGHYFAFVKPTKEDRWLRFDDDRVIPVAKKEVLEANYGGEFLGGNYHGFKRFTNAYMLVYIRQSMQDEILADVSEHDIPRHLVTKLEEERKKKHDEDKEKSEEHLHIRVQIITEKAFELNEGFDFIPKNDHLWGDESTSPIQGLKVRRAMKFGEFKDLLAEKLATPKNQFRVWSIVNRQNRTIRADDHIVEANNEDQTISDILNRYLTNHALLRIFVERISTNDQPDEGQYPPLVPVTDNLVFIKYFDPENQLISGMGYLYVNKTDKIGSISDRVKMMIGYELEAKVDLYEEIKPNMTDKMDMEKTFEQAEIQHGDIICVQKTLTEEEQAQLIKDEKYPTIPDFLDFMFRRVDVIFTPRNRDPSMEFKLTLKKNMQYAQVVQRVADKLQANPQKVQLFTPPEAHANEEPLPIPPNSPHLLGEILRHIGGGMISANPMLVYQVHDISLAELEMKRTLEITLCTPTLSDTNTIKVLVSKRGCIADLLQVLQAQGATFRSDSGTRQARIFQALNNKFHREFVDSDPITAISDSQIARLYAEEVPQEELEMYDGEEGQPFYLPVFHYQRDLQRTHSVPFQLLLKKDEEFSETKKRLQLRTGMNDKDWSKVKFSMVSARSSKPIQEDAIKLWDVLLQLDEQSALGLDHIDKLGRVRSVFDKPLSIRG
ncbi:hypothetical protein BDB00DRAFT_874264 [Zychaea mexicana]|uniref:uncharacterized protein n=1 Tax=Zychaea mexicana TaxID=64656 RepID=UPI0022FED452|nr:uncharacterized protein BDB00DRAFT_874264 [Zychaea mexicana]KAI9491534.1 hypothetical protein BDB00DRAFT_874264 [Zychaea mexicana]